MFTTCSAYKAAPCRGSPGSHRGTVQAQDDSAPSELHVHHAAPGEGTRIAALSSASPCDSSLGGQRSPRRAGGWGTVGTVTSRGPGASRAAPVPSCGTEVTCPDQLCWTNLCPCPGSSPEHRESPRSQNWRAPGARSAAPGPSPSSQNCTHRLAQTMLPTESISNATNTLKPCYTLY